MPAPHRVRIVHFNPWAGAPGEAAAFVTSLAQLDVRTRVSNPADERLRRMARLDSDWHGECARCFAGLSHPEIEFQPALAFGPTGAGEVLAAVARRTPGEEWWLVFMGQHPQKLGALLGRFCAMFRKSGGRVLYYAFDEASREMPSFNELAPHLDVLIHDEEPLSEAARTLIRSECLTQHRSWVANVLPFSVPFNETPEAKILFLGSQLGLTPHRQRQLDHLRGVFGDRLVAHHDHSVEVAARDALNRYQVGLCPEGRKFTTPAMARSHTDRPFWSGCLGLVPVCEDSRQGGRLEELHQAGLILRYPHGDLAALTAACEQALAMPNAYRRRIYDHFNRHETVGAVVAGALAARVGDPVAR